MPPPSKLRTVEPRSRATTAPRRRARARGGPRLAATALTVRTYVRVETGDDPARRSGRVLRVRRASRDERSLRGRPVLVGMGVVLAASYEAKAFGVRTAMSERQARGLCPHAASSSRASPRSRRRARLVFEVFEDTTPLVEGLSIDEAFLDVRGMERGFGTPARDRASGFAATCWSGSACRSRSASPGRSSWPRWRARSRNRTACSSSRPTRSSRSCIRFRWSGSGVSARSPPRSCARAGSRRCARSRCCRSPCSCRCSAAASGRHLHALAHNLDPRPVRTGRGAARSARSAHSAGRRRSAEALDAALIGLVDRVTRRLRAAGRVGRTVVLRLRFDDFTRATRSHTLPADRADPHDPRRRRGAAGRGDADDRAARASPSSAWPSPTSRTTRAVQLMLPFDRRNDGALDAAVDEVKARFGRSH